MQNTFASLAPQSVRTRLWFIIVILLLTSVTACIVDDEGDPQIISMTVTPSQVSRSEAGTTIFTATIQIANFDDEITDAEVYIVSPERKAEPDKFEIEGDTIILSEIGKNWFGGLDAGVYNIGALVKTETVTIRENNVTTVTITD